MGFLFFGIARAKVRRAIKKMKSLVGDFIFRHEKELIHLVMAVTQFVVGTTTNFVLAFYVVRRLDVHISMPIVILANVARIAILIRVHDWAHQTPPKEEEDKKARKMFWAIIFFVLGYLRVTIITVVSNYYGVLHIRGGHPGIPAKFWGKVGFAIVVSSIMFVLATKGIFSIWDAIWKIISQFYWDLIFPFPIIL